MNSNISISWANGEASHHGIIEIDVKSKGVDVFFALARATSGILRNIAKDGEFDGLLMEYIGLLTHVAHDDGEQVAGLDLSGGHEHGADV